MPFSTNLTEGEFSHVVILQCDPYHSSNTSSLMTTGGMLSYSCALTAQEESWAESSFLLMSHTSSA